MTFHDRVLQIVQPEIDEVIDLFQASQLGGTDMSHCCNAILKKLRQIEQLLTNKNFTPNEKILNDDEHEDEKVNDEPRTIIDEFIDSLPQLDPDSIVDQIYTKLGHYFAKIPGPRFPRDEEYFARIFKYIVESLSPLDEIRTLKSMLDTLNNQQKLDSHQQRKSIEQSSYEMQSQLRRQSGTVGVFNQPPILTGYTAQWEDASMLKSPRGIDYRNYQTIYSLCSKSQSRINAVSDQLTSVADDIDSIGRSVSSFDSRIDAVSDQLASMAGDIESIGRSVSSFQECCDRVQSVIRRLS